MRLRLLPVLLLTVAVLLASCAQVETSEPVATAKPLPSDTPLPPIATSTQIPVPPTDTPKPTATSTLAPTPHPISTMNAVVSVLSLNMRSGPSTIHQVIAAYPEDTSVLVLAKALGDDWVKVDIEGETGWMSVEHLDLEDEVAYLPVEEEVNSMIISGKVVDSEAKPVNDIDVAVLQRLLDTSIRTDAYSGQDGYFYAYIPLESTGLWEAQIVGARCGSHIVDEYCHLDGYFVYNYRVVFEPPPISPIVFMYEISTAEITGVVTDADGEPVSMRVFADRSDGSYSYALSSPTGEFSIPISEGIWEVYAIQYNPLVEGESVTIQVVPGETLEPIDLVAPE